MRKYGVVSPQFWLGKTGRLLRGHAEAQIVSIYLMTCPHANMIGLFYLPKAYVAHETGLTFEGALKGLQRCIEAGFCSYDDQSETVFVHAMAKYQVGESLKPKDNQVVGVQREYDSVPENPYLSVFFDKYNEAFHMQNKREAFTSCNPSLTKIEGASNPLRSQEQEQDQEQEQEHLKSISQNTREYSQTENQDLEIPPFKEPDSEQGDRRTTWKEFGLVELPENWLSEALEKIPNASKELCESKFAAMVDYFINSRPFEHASDWQAKFESWVRKDAKPVTAAQTSKSSGTETTITTAGLVPKKQRYYGIDPEVFMKDVRPGEDYEMAAKRIFLSQQEVSL